MAKQPEGIDDISKAIMAAIKAARSGAKPRNVYGNINRTVRTKVLPESFSRDKAYIGKRFNISEKNYNPNAFPKNPPLTKKASKKIMKEENKNWMMPDGEMMPRKQAKKALKKDKKIMSKKYGSK